MAPGELVTILDGGMSRELIRVGAPFGQPEWSALALIEAPEYVQRVHSEFIEAGADVITTNSYALVPFHIGDERFRKRGTVLAALAGKQARAAAESAERPILVAGSLPPIFGSYEPDRFDPARAREFLAVLVDAMSQYIDVWLCETLSLIAEAKAAEAAVHNSHRPLWVAFTVDDQRTDGLVTLRSGETVSSAVEWALRSSAEAILFNCSNPEFLGPAVQVAAQLISVRENPSRKLAFGAYGNAFSKTPRERPANEGHRLLREDLGPQEYAAFARDWVKNGAIIVGGCCGIGRDHISILTSEFKSNP